MSPACSSGSGCTAGSERLVLHRTGVTMPRTHQRPSERASVEPEAALDAFIGKFDPAHRALIGEVRAALRRRFPAANELVYDNYNFFVIGYAATLRPSDAVLSIAASAKGVSL